MKLRNDFNDLFYNKRELQELVSECNFIRRGTNKVTEVLPNSNTLQRPSWKKIDYNDYQNMDTWKKKKIEEVASLAPP